MKMRFFATIFNWERPQGLVKSVEGLDSAQPIGFS
jgi:hypothetical protein